MNEDCVGFARKQWYLHRIQLSQEVCCSEVARQRCDSVSERQGLSCFHLTLQVNAALLLGGKNMPWPLWGSSSPRRTLSACVETRLFLPYFVKVGHFQPLDNNGWEQIHESNTFDLWCLSFKGS